MKLNIRQKSLLDRTVKGEWTINPDTVLVDVVGSVIMSYWNLTEMPVKFG
jgi:hypothetical protein